METLRRFWEDIKNLFESLDRKRRIYILLSAIITIVFIVAFVKFMTSISYSVLFSGLGPSEAGSIVERLREDDISYRLENGGSTILVPKSKVYDLRLTLANQGLPQAGTIGYEIFDQNNIGTTDFVQKINYRRALEGELARTISTLNEVKAARVHLVIPEEKLFVEDQKKTTASITVKLNSGNSLSYRQTQGIANLVSASVEGLRSENVTIVDSNGNILTEPSESNSMLSLSTNQMELKRKVEEHYSRNLTSLLENVVGQDRVAVQVTAELNFDQVERTIKKYDPDNPAIISEQSNTQFSEGSGNNNSQTNEDVIKNYGVNQTIERIVRGIGNIERLSVAAMVDGKYQSPSNGGENASPKYVPLSKKELNQLSNIVKSAIGFSEERQDEVKVVNMPFDRSHLKKEAKALEAFEKRMFWEKMIKRGIYLIAAIIIGLIIFKIYKSFKTIFMPYFGPSNLSLGKGAENLDMDMFNENKENIQLQKSVANLSKKNPHDAAKLVKAWVSEEQNV